MKKEKGLGKGLETLLGNFNTVGDNNNELMYLALEQLQPSQYQPRLKADTAALQELAASILAQGIMQPLLVRKIAIDRYEIIAGERRYQAAKIAELEKIPVLVRDVETGAAAAMALIENIQRENLNPIEEARGIQRLIQEFDFSHEKVAEAIGRSRSSVSNLLRLLSSAEVVQTLLQENALDMGHARALLALKKSEQALLAQKIVHQNLSVRATEKIVMQLLQKKEKESPLYVKNTSNPQITEIQNQLADMLALEVQLLASSKNRGKLIIKFNNLDELERLLEKMQYSSH